MPDELSQDLFALTDPYTLEQLNQVIRDYAANDQRLADIVTQLLAFYTQTTQPPGQVQTPAQIQAQITSMYDLGNTAARVYPLAPTDPLRYYQEIKNVLTKPPFADLLAGVPLDPAGHVLLLKIFTVLKGLLYFVHDGPNYNGHPTFAQDGSFFYTTLARVTNGITEYLLVDVHGVPATLNSVPIYQALPLGPRFISLLDYRLKQIELNHLRTLYRISAFEAGIDVTYQSSYPYRLVHEAFVPAKRLPCGFAQAGPLLFVRSDIAQLAQSSNLAPLIPTSGFPNAGVDERLVLDDSLVLTPMGMIRIPKSILSYSSLISPNWRTSHNGDPVFIVSLKVVLEIKEQDVAQLLPTAMPRAVTGNGFASTIIPLVNGDAPAFTNDSAQTGTQRDHLDIVGHAGHEQGRLIPYTQNSLAQFCQIQVSLVVDHIDAGDLATRLEAFTGFRDEVSLLGPSGTDLDPSPLRTLGMTPRRACETIAANYTGYTYDPDQIVLTQVTTTGATGSLDKTWSAIIPLFAHLAKNSNPASTQNPNGCVNTLEQAWAVHRISSVQASLETIALDDGAGNAVVIPEDYVGADVTFYSVTPVKSTFTRRVGDKLAAVPGDLVTTLQTGDLVVIDQRVPEASLDGVYRNEAAKQSIIDLRTHVIRLIEPVVESAGMFSPSPSPTGEQYALVRNKPVELVQTLLNVYNDLEASVESKLRWNLQKGFLQKVADRKVRIDLAKATPEQIETFLLDYVRHYDLQTDHAHVTGEGIAVHWPTKSAVTTISLRQYPRNRILNQEDQLTIEDTPGWGPVPVLTKYLLGSGAIRHPIRFDSTLPFLPDKNLVVPGHTKMAGTFFLRPADTQVTDPLIHVTLYQTQVVNGAVKQVFLGSFDFDWTKADSITNAVGVIKIDGDTSYNPVTQRINVNYTETLNFSTTEPGQITFAYTYHDLTQIHPLWQVDPAAYGLSLSHLADAQALAVTKGVATKAFDTLRLDGLSFVNGVCTVRFNIDDAFKVLALGSTGAIQTKWVVKGLPWLTITDVTYNAVGEPVSVAYTANWVDQNQTVTTVIAQDTRCRQVYQPCAVKYGWTDPGQSNVNSDASPFQANPRFGFYQLQNFLSAGGLLSAGAKATFFLLDQGVLDYRFTQPFSWALPMSDLTPISSAAVLYNRVTGARMAVPGVFRAAVDNGVTVSLSEELDLPTVNDQQILYVRLGSLSSDWVLDFAGMLVTVTDAAGLTVGGSSKLALVGYWYGGHTLTDRAAMSVSFGVDSLSFQTQVLTKVPDFYRVGDLPGRYLLRDNGLLVTERKRPV